MYCLAAKAADKDKAVKLLNFLGGYGSDGTASTARFWFAQRGLGFAFKDMANDPDVQTELAKFADPAVYAGLADTAKARNALAAPWYSEFESALQKVTQQLLTNQSTGSAAVASLTETATSLAKKYS
jgi:multiple sugar transport system substrate-binding protein